MGVMNWRDLTAESLASEVDAQTVAVLPLGATEQHGPHLPLGTDTVIADGLVDSALKALPMGLSVLRLPTLSLGQSLEHTAYPGTLTLSSTTFQGMLNDLGDAVARAGCRRLVLFSSHGGNLADAETMALALRARHAMLVVKACYFDFPPPATDPLPEREQREGLHGGALETALMLHYAPEQVITAKVSHWPSVDFTALADYRWLGAESGAGRFAWMAGDLNAAGVSGNATLATAAMGKALDGHYAGILAELIGEAARFPLSALRGSDPE